MLLYISLVNLNPPDVIKHIKTHMTSTSDTVALDFYFVVREPLLLMVHDIVRLIESETGIEDVYILNHPLNGFLHHSRVQKWGKPDD